MSWFHPSPEHPPYLIPTSQSSHSQDHDSHCTVLCLPSFFAGRVCGFFLSYFHPRMPSDGLNRHQRPANYFLPPQNYMNPNTIFISPQMTWLDQVHALMEENPKWATEPVLNKPSNWMPMVWWHILPTQLWLFFTLLVYIIFISQLQKYSSEIATFLRWFEFSVFGTLPSNTP